MFGGVHFSDYPDPDNVSVMDGNCLSMIHDMQRYGIRLDVPYLNSLTQEIKSKQLDILEELSIYLGAYQDFNGKSYQPFLVSSPDHVSRLLFDHLRVQGDDAVPMTPKGKRYTTSDDTLMLYESHPVVSLILEWRELDKLRGTYTEPLALLVDSESRLHPSFNVTVVASGRLSASYVQTIPTRTDMGKQVRRAFIASPGCVLVSCDLSQIEMRWAAHLSQDPNMCDVFRNDGDIHVRTACGIFGHDYSKVLPMYKALEAGTAGNLYRDHIPWLKQFKQEERLPSKSAGFGVLFEMTPPGLQTYLVSLGLKKSDWPEDRCAVFINGFYGEYSRIRPYQDGEHNYATRYGLSIDAFGRVRLMPEVRSALKWIRSEGYRKTSNHKIQASAQGTIKLAMAELNPWYREVDSIRGRCVPQLQVHDALILDVKKELAEEVAHKTREVMENATPLIIPVRSSADVGETWYDL